MRRRCTLLLLLALTACSTARPQAAPAPSVTSPPAASPTPSPTPSPRPAITLAFGGDVHFEGAIRGRLRADPSTVFGDVAAVLRAADLAMVNLETAVTERGTPANKDYVFRAPASAFAALRAAGIDVATNANNHGMDYGQVGLRDTLAAARASRFPLVGSGTDEQAAFSPYRVTVHGWRVAVIGATSVLDNALKAAWTAGPGKPGLASAYHLDALVQAVRAARAGADTVVVYLHWGTEMHGCPTPAQQELARALTEAGADVVVGSHAHVLLGDGHLGTTYVAYGLGNFLFYASGSGPTSQSEVLTLTVRGRQVTGVRHTPVRVGGGSVHLVTGTAGERATQRIAGLRGCTGLT